MGKSNCKFGDCALKSANKYMEAMGIIKKCKYYDKENNKCIAKDAKIDGKTLNEWVNEEQKAQTGTFWGREYKFDPVLLDEVFGDGLQLAYLQSMNDRPYYYIVLLDSSRNFDDDEWMPEWFEEIISWIEENYGQRWDDETDQEQGYPAISWDGGRLETIANFGDKNE